MGAVSFSEVEKGLTRRKRTEQRRDYQRKAVLLCDCGDLEAERLGKMDFMALASLRRDYLCAPRPDEVAYSPCPSRWVQWRERPCLTQHREVSIVGQSSFSACWYSPLMAAVMISLCLPLNSCFPKTGGMAHTGISRASLHVRTLCSQPTHQT